MSHSARSVLYHVVHDVRVLSAETFASARAALRSVWVCTFHARALPCSADTLPHTEPRFWTIVGGGGGSPQDKAFGEKFLAENKAKEGVSTLPSGLQYKVLRAGDGNSHPLPNSPCDCHYEGRCAKDWPAGKKFDSSYDRGSPTTFAPNQVIAGWVSVCVCTCPPFLRWIQVASS